MQSLSKQRSDKFSIQSNTTQNTLWSAQDARALGYCSLLRALIQSLVRNCVESKVSLLRLFPFCHFKRVWPFGEDFLSLNRNLIKEIMSCRKQNKYLRHAAYPAASEQVTIQLFQAKDLTWQGLSFKNQIQQWDQTALQEINYLLCLVRTGLFCIFHNMRFLISQERKALLQSKNGYFYTYNIFNRVMPQT